ncbi:MAG: hypothetical protein AW07_02913 [Candidatus Accumulibacter sp. SK-11]|nr:MAG: hypothetical protein AW07_02913 [Candidatus Accumulibacter sp. SK-11]
MLQHVEDELLFDRLPHRVAVRGLPIAAKNGERLVLGSGGESEEAQVRLPAALGHAAKQIRHAVASFLHRTLLRFVPQSLATEHFLEVSCRLAALRAMGLVDDHRAAPRSERARATLTTLLGQLEQLPRDEGELLQRRNDHGYGIFECLGELPRALVDALHDATLVLELVDRVLKLLVEHHAVGHHDDAIEHALVGRVVQRCEPMRQPADGVALAAAGRVFDEVVVPHAVGAR